MFLKKGDLVDVVSPASSITKNEFAKIKLFLEENGLRARFHMAGELLLKNKQSHNFPSFSAEKRFKQLHFALENKESKAVWCVRGGYGSADLIPFLEKLKPLPSKIFIGFSDVTSLGIFLQQNWNWKIIYGPMLVQIVFDKVLAASKKAIIDFIFGKKIELKYKLIEKNSAAKALFSIEDEIVGGCLSVLASHFSTSNQLNWHNKILFLEDIDESGERLDRYFCQLVQIMAKIKSTPRAILLGNYYHGLSSPKQKQNIAFAINKLADRLQENKINIPLLEEKTKCLGHAKNMMPLLIGEKAKISNNMITQKFS